MSTPAPDPLIAYIRPEDGGLTILVPTGDIPFAQVYQKDVPEGAEAKVIDRADVPLDRTFRNAWELLDDKIAINFTKAKEVAMDRWRRWLRQERALAITDEEDRAMRAKYAQLRNDIVEADDLDTLQALMTQMGVPE